MKKYIKLFTVLNILIFFFIGCGIKDKQKKVSENEKQKEEVTIKSESIKQIKLATEIVTTQPFTGYITIPAKVITNQDNEAQVGSPLPGRVHSVLVNIGDFVKTGQVVMYIEGLEIGEIKAGYLKAKANYDFTKADLERHKLLLEQNIGSKQSYYEAEAEFQKANAEFQAEDKKIHSVGMKDEEVNNGTNNIQDDHISGRLAIKSPINGIIVERNVVIGQQVDASTNAFKVINTNSIWIDGQMYEKDIANIVRKTSVEFKTSVYPMEKFVGRVIYVGQVVDEHTRTITIRSEFTNSNNKLKPQMFGELKIPVGKGTKAIMIPDEAVFKDAGIDYVFVKQEKVYTPTEVQSFEMRKVITGVTVNSRIEIKDGLSIGESIVTKGVFYLKSEIKKEEFGGDE